MYYLRRLLIMIPLLIVISFLAFTMIRVAPGGPFDKEQSSASPEIKRALEAKYHLDEPLWKQYLRYLGGLVQGDLGPSLKYRSHSVNDILAQALPVSLTLGLLSFLFAQGVGLPLGYLAAVHKGRWQDWLGSFLAILAICIPPLVVGPLLVMWVAVKWKLLPVALWASPWHVILPTMTLGIYFSGRIARLMREGMLTTLNAPYITTARAKGLSETAIHLKHAVRLAILPVVSYSGPMLADLLTGSFVVEYLFRLPGIGVFFVNSFLNRDYLMLVGLVLIYALLLIVLNFIVDLTYTLLDRRVRYE